MSQAKGPESQVGGRVGDGAQTVLNGVDGLVHKRLTKIKLHGRRRLEDVRDYTYSFVPFPSKGAGNRVLTPPLPPPSPNLFSLPIY